MNALFERIATEIDSLRRRVQALESQETTLLSAPTIRGHVLIAGGAPTLSAGAQLGNGTLSLVSDSTDFVGKVVVTAGSTTAQGELAIVTFAKPFANVPFVLCTMQGSSFGYLRAKSYSESMTSFRIYSYDAPVSGGAYPFMYICAGF